MRRKRVPSIVNQLQKNVLFYDSLSARPSLPQELLVPFSNVSCSTCMQFQVVASLLFARRSLIHLSMDEILGIPRVPTALGSSRATRWIAATRMGTSLRTGVVERLFSGEQDRRSGRHTRVLCLDHTSSVGILSVRNPIIRLRTVYQFDSSI